MTPIRLVQRQAFNPVPMHWALMAHPELWDQNTARTEHPDSPHHGLSDIWARFAAPGVDGSQPHESVWHPCANLLPIREVVYPLMAMVQGDKLGGVLITKIPAGKTCRPHVDNGWHAREYQKFGLQVQSAPGQKFCFDNHSLETMPGDLFWFRNDVMHWVENPTPHDRITVIACIRTDKEF